MQDPGNTIGGGCPDLQDPVDAAVVDVDALLTVLEFRCWPEKANAHLLGLVAHWVTLRYDYQTDFVVGP